MMCLQKKPEADLLVIGADNDGLEIIVGQKWLDPVEMRVRCELIGRRPDRFGWTDDGGFWLLVVSEELELTPGEN